MKPKVNCSALKCYLLFHFVVMVMFIHGAFVWFYHLLNPPQSRLVWLITKSSDKPSLQFWIWRSNPRWGPIGVVLCETTPQRWYLPTSWVVILNGGWVKWGEWITSGYIDEISKENRAQSQAGYIFSITACCEVTVLHHFNLLDSSDGNDWTS